jgi:hypothetical protein
MSFLSANQKNHITKNVNTALPKAKTALRALLSLIFG